jgi:hypothetical protein
MKWNFAQVCVEFDLSAVSTGNLLAAAGLGPDSDGLYDVDLDLVFALRDTAESLRKTELETKVQLRKWKTLRNDGRLCTKDQYSFELDLIWRQLIAAFHRSRGVQPFEKKQELFDEVRDSLKPQLRKAFDV